MPAAISYIRFSAAHQGKGSTTERQQKMIDEWLLEHPEYKLSPLSVSDLGKSGYKGEHLRSGLGSILEAIDAKKIQQGDVLLIEALDRLGRLPASEMHPLIWSIVKAGVAIVTLEDRITYSERSLNEDHSLLFILTGKVQQAHDYSQRLSRRIKGAYERKRREARNGERVRVPRPYWVDSEGKLIPDKAEEMRKCIDLYLKGYGYRQIIIELDLNESSYRTLRRRFQNRALIGEWANKAEGKPIAGVFEQLIDADTFHRLQKRMALKRLTPVPAGEYELSGLVKCGNCGASLHFRRRAYKNYVIFYANCSKYLKKASCDNGKTWPYEVLLSLFNSDYRSTFELLGTAMDKVVHEAAPKIQPLRNEIEELEKSQKAAFAILKENNDDSFALDQYRAVAEPLKAKQAQLKRLEDEMESPDPDSTELWNHVFEIDADPIQKREVIKQTDYRVVVLEDKAVAGDLEYQLLRRSQKHRCYIVKVVDSSLRELLEDGSEQELSNEYSIKYKAISRSNEIEASTLDDLERKLLAGELQGQERERKCSI